MKNLFVILIMAAFVMLQSGCARLRLPAIDPSGNRIFLPGNQTTGLLTPHSGRTGSLGLSPQTTPPMGTFQPAPLVDTTTPTIIPSPYPVQPVFTQAPDAPPCDGSGCGTKKFHQVKHLVPKIDGHKTPGQNGEIIMTPSRIIAPVGSEVVVLAGICGGDGFFVKNQPLEWMLSNNSVGQFVEVGGMNHSTFNQLVPPSSRKFDGQYAWGRTGLKNIVLSRGTPTPLDDIELVKGQTFISVSSASPGTSYVTGVAPKAEGWDKRRASTTIHWVDGQWSIPAPAQATAGTVYPLTTVVSRTDGGGATGWTVRYEIVGGSPAEFAPAGSQTAEAKTNSDGQATVQIRQPSGQFEPGTTQVRVDVVRPSVFGEPELIVESGVTTVTWSAPALTIRAIGPRTAGLDQPFNYRVEVTNPGDQIARDVIVRTKDLDDAIEYISSSPKPVEYGRQYEWKLGDIPPGSPPRAIDVQLKSKKRGNIGLCFEVVSDTDRLRTEACAETEIAVPCIGFDISGPTSARVGEDVTFNLNVQNQCDEALEDVRLTLRHGPGLLRPGKSNPATFELPMLQFNETRSLPITFNVQSLGTQCFDVEITAKNGHTSSARRCIEVGEMSQQQRDDQVELEVSGARPTVVGGNSLVTVSVTNRGNTPLNNPVLTNRFSSSVEPISVTDGFNYDWLGNEELAIYLGNLAPGENRKIEILYQGKVVDAGATSEFAVTTPTGAQATERIHFEIGPAGSAPQGGGGPQQPDFGAGGGDGGGGSIGIPRDPAGVQGDLSIDVRSLTPRIQMLNTDQRNTAVPQSSEIEFVVKNNRGTPMRDVDITLNIPPSLKLTDFNFGDSNLDLVKRNDDFTQFFVRRVLELRAGEELRFVATVLGQQPSTVNFEVTAESPDLAGTKYGNASVTVVP